VQLQSSIRDKFVTGNWNKKPEGEENENEGEGMGKDGGEGEEEVYGDFEDLETGQKFSAPKKEKKGL
jgi:ribosome biogenesis protein BMS1